MMIVIDTSLSRILWLLILAERMQDMHERDSEITLVPDRGMKKTFIPRTSEKKDGTWGNMLAAMWRSTTLPWPPWRVLWWAPWTLNHLRYQRSCIRIEQLAYSFHMSMSKVSSPKHSTCESFLSPSCLVPTQIKMMGAAANQNDHPECR